MQVNTHTCTDRRLMLTDAQLGERYRQLTLPALVDRPVYVAVDLFGKLIEQDIWTIRIEGTEDGIDPNTISAHWLKCELAMGGAEYRGTNIEFVDAGPAAQQLADLLNYYEDIRQKYLALTGEKPVPAFKE